MINYMNYFLTSKYSRLVDGHLKSEDLYKKILHHDGETAFCCYFDLDSEKLKLEYDTGFLDKDGKTIYEYHLEGSEVDGSYTCNGKSFTQYEGVARAALGCISFDFDSDDLNESLSDVRRFVEWLDVEDIAVFFSGGKGFHVMIPSGYFPLDEDEHLPNKLKDLAKYLKGFYKTLDDSIYNYNRKFRVPFTKHDKSGLYKILVDVNLTIEEIKEQATKPQTKDFLKGINLSKKRKPIPVIYDAIESSKRKSYDIEKDKAGKIDAPSPFEKFDGKLCISKMMESRCDDIGRNNACMRIVNDYFRTGKTQSKCETDIFSWSQENGLPMNEVSTIIANIYQRGGNYNFGCQDECKSVYCSAKCSIWKKLAPDKRPTTVDMPQSALVEQGQAKQPKEFDVVRKVLFDTFHCDWDDKYKKFENGEICKQGKKDLFFYKEGYWQHLNDEQLDLIKIKFNAIYDNILSTRRIDSIFKMFMMYVPSKPNEIDMFVPRANVANFSNGTLHLLIDNKGKYSFDFREHDRLDFITFKVDFEYDENLTAKNQKFEDWLFDYLSEDQEQFNLVQEMFGASLVPTFPQLFALVGPAATGKTTLIKVLKMIHGNDERNICKVPPHQFNGYNMGSMIGKLVNIVTDINTRAKIDDDIVKQIEDRDTVRIERKFLEDIYAPLPALHIFGANSMPHTLEGYSGAMARRWSIIKFNKLFSGVRNRNIAYVLFNSEPQGIVNFAVKGLMRLAKENQGFFSKSLTSQNAVEEWTTSDDIIQMFINDGVEEGLSSGEHPFKIEVGQEKKIQKSKLWDCFAFWQEEGLARNDQIGRTKFYKMMELKGFPIKKFTKNNYIVGLGEC